LHRLTRVSPVAVSNSIGRSVDDSCWPLPVWGHLDAVEAYTDERIEVLRAALLADAG